MIKKKKTVWFLIRNQSIYGAINQSCIERNELLILAVTTFIHFVRDTVRCYHEEEFFFVGFDWPANDLSRVQALSRSRENFEDQDLSSCTLACSRALNFFRRSICSSVRAVGVTTISFTY
jgi:hypothetical protein